MCVSFWPYLNLRIIDAHEYYKWSHNIYRNNPGQIRQWSIRLINCMFPVLIILFVWFLFCLFVWGGVYFLQINIYFLIIFFLWIHVLFQGSLFSNMLHQHYMTRWTICYDWHMKGLGTVYIVTNPFIYLFPLKP